jgi:hypothetical protein
MHGTETPYNPSAYLISREQLSQATGLIREYGEIASYEAGQRAVDARDIGNFISFSQWRTVERLIPWLTAQTAIGTIQ